MANMYDAWREAKRRLADNPADEFLQNLVDNLVVLALQDYVTDAFRRMDIDGMYEPGDVTPEDVSKFLDGLDELRAPSQAELQQIRRDLHKQVLDATTKLLRLPWTGETRYDEAIADVRAVLSAVIDGKPWPVLERLRCPSLYGAVHVGSNTADLIRCSLQLPHGENHISPEVDGKSFTWTDEQSVNPPKPYDEPTKPTEAQLDKLAAEVFRGPAERAAKFCHERHPQTRQLCVRRPHPDAISHVTANGRAW